MSNILAVKGELKSSEFSINKNGYIVTKKYENDTSSLLVQNMCNFLASENLTLNDLAQIIVSSGPGSFTAIRAIMSMAKCFDSVFNIPVKVVSIFDLFEKKYENEIQNKNICIIVNGNLPDEVFMKKIYTNGCFFYSVISIDDVLVNISDVDYVFSSVCIQEKFEYIFDIEILDTSSLLAFSDCLMLNKCLKTEKIEPFYFKDIYEDKAKTISKHRNY